MIYISINIQVFTGQQSLKQVFSDVVSTTAEHVSQRCPAGGILFLHPTPLRDICRRRRRSISSHGNAGELFYCVVQGGDSSGLQCREQALTDSPSEAE